MLNRFEVSSVVSSASNSKYRKTKGVTIREIVRSLNNHKHVIKTNWGEVEEHILDLLKHKRIVAIGDGSKAFRYVTMGR